MSDGVHLGYQAALVSMPSPTYGRLWLGVTPHPGNPLSCSQAEALVRAAAAQTGTRPYRRVGLLQMRVAAIEQQREERTRQLRRAEEVWDDVARERDFTQRDVGYWQQQVAALQAAYELADRPVGPHSKLNQARARTGVQAKRLVKLEQRLPQVPQWVTEATQRLGRVAAEHAQLVARLAQLEQDNRTNRAPIVAEFRLDGGFGTGENLAVLIELGYAVYSKPYSPHITERLRAQITAQTAWTRVGSNAEVVGCAAVTVGDCPYPLDGAVERFYTGATQRYSSRVHYGSDPVLDDLAAGFSEYNGRQTIAAGIKEGKGVFQMHHLKVRALPGLDVQEQVAALAANFVRGAGRWLVTNCQQDGPARRLGDAAVKSQVQVGAHTSAWVHHQDGTWVVEFTDHSIYAGSVIRTREWAFPLPLPLFRSSDFVPIWPIWPLVAQKLH